MSEFWPYAERVIIVAKVLSPNQITSDFMVISFFLSLDLLNGRFYLMQITILLELTKVV